MLDGGLQILFRPLADFKFNFARFFGPLTVFRSTSLLMRYVIIHRHSGYEKRLISAIITIILNDYTYNRVQFCLIEIETTRIRYQTNF